MRQEAAWGAAKLQQVPEEAGGGVCCVWWFPTVIHGRAALKAQKVVV